MSKERKIDDAELADISGASGGIQELNSGGSGSGTGSTATGSVEKDGGSGGGTADDPQTNDPGGTIGGDPPITNWG